MALMGTRTAVDAVVAYTRGVSGVQVFLSTGPTPPVGKACIIHPTAGQPDGVLGDPDRNVEVEFQTTCLGSGAEQVLWVHDQVVARLNRATITGTGWVSYPLRMIPGTTPPVRRDDTLAAPLYVLTTRWLLVAQPAT